MVPADAALMIVGLLTVRLSRRCRVAGADRMTIEEVVKQVLRDEHAEAITASIRGLGR